MGYNGMYGFFSNIAIYQIVTSIIGAIFGAFLYFGPLKWRKGLLTTTAIGWGAVLGLLVGTLLTQRDPSVWIVSTLVGVILLPILTYKVPAVNRFILGYVVFEKLGFMLSTELARNGYIQIEMAVVMPIAIGVVVGIILMAWTKIRIGAFSCGVVFLGSVNLATNISKIINQIHFGITGDIRILLDPVDIIFAMFGIELTDKWTLVAMVFLMIIGVYRHVKILKAEGFSLDTPVIAYETNDPSKHGKIYTK